MKDEIPLLQPFQIQPLTLTEPKQMNKIMKKIRDDLKSNNEITKSAFRPNLKPIIPSFKIENLQPPIAPIVPAIFPITTSNEQENMIEIMKKLKQEIKDINKVRSKPQKTKFQIQPISLSKPDKMEEAMKKIREKLVKPDQTNILNNFPSAVTQTLDINDSKATFEAIKMKDIMKKIREDLLKTDNTNKEILNSETETSSFISIPSQSQNIKIQPISLPRPDKMEEVMKKIREDLMKAETLKTEAKTDTATSVKSMFSQVSSQNTINPPDSSKISSQT